MEKNIKKECVCACIYIYIYVCVCVCITESLCCTAEISTVNQHVYLWRIHFDIWQN